MANRRAQIAMTDDEVQSYLDEQRVLNVATLGPSGRVIDDYEQILHLGRELAVRYNGPAGLADELVPFIEAQARKRLVVEFEVERVVSWDHSKISGY